MSSKNTDWQELLKNQKGIFELIALIAKGRSRKLVYEIHPVNVDESFKVSRQQIRGHTMEDSN